MWTVYLFSKRVFGFKHDLDFIAQVLDKFHAESYSIYPLSFSGKSDMRRITQLDYKEMATTVHAEGEQSVKTFIRYLLMYMGSQRLLEEVADMLLEELEHRALLEDC